MTAFKQDFKIDEAVICNTLTFTDNSNFDANDEGYTPAYFDRHIIQVFDNNNTQIGDDIQMVFVVDETHPAANIVLDKDRWLSILYTLQHSTDIPLTKRYNIVLTCNVDGKFGILVVSEDDCNCGCDNDKTLFKIVKTSLASRIFAKRANPVLSQRMLDKSNAYADSAMADSDSNCNCN